MPGIGEWGKRHLSDRVMRQRPDGRMLDTRIVKVFTLESEAEA